MSPTWPSWRMNSPTGTGRFRKSGVMPLPPCPVRIRSLRLTALKEITHTARSSVSMTHRCRPGSGRQTLAGVVEFHAAIDPARPFQTLALKNLLPPPEAKRFTREERDLLLHDGISTFTVDAGGRVAIERVITTYQTNTSGVEDISYLDYNTVATVDYIRYAVKARIALRFPRYKLADDGTHYAPGQAVVTPNVIRAELIGLFRELEAVALVEGFEQFKNDLIVVRSDADPNRVNCIFPPDIINQFRVFAAAVQFRL